MYCNTLLFLRVEIKHRTDNVLILGYQYPMLSTVIAVVAFRLTANAVQCILARTTAFDTVFRPIMTIGAGQTR